MPCSFKRNFWTTRKIFFWTLKTWSNKTQGLKTLLNLGSCNSYHIKKWRNSWQKGVGGKKNYKTKLKTQMKPSSLKFDELELHKKTKSDLK